MCEKCEAAFDRAAYRAHLRERLSLLEAAPIRLAGAMRTLCVSLDRSAALADAPISHTDLRHNRLR
jgi:hypothetical protein